MFARFIAILASHKTAEAGQEALKSSIPIATILWGWASEHSQTVLTIATICYVILQAAHLIWKWRKESNKGRKK